MQIARTTDATPGRYRCDRCGVEGDGKRLPRGWHRRSDDHVCPECWSAEPDEWNGVLRYGCVSVRHASRFWDYQRAAILLWNGLVDLSDAAFAEATELRRRYAPDECASVDAQNERAKAAWVEIDAAQAAVKAARVTSHFERDELPHLSAAGKSDTERRLAEATAHARAQSEQLGKLYRDAKTAAKTNGADESPIWQRLQRAQAVAATWTYWSQERDGRTYVSRSDAASAWRLPRSLADQVIVDYQRAWSAWISRRSQGRGKPKHHGMGLERVRAVVTYSNGMDVERLLGGRLESCSLKLVSEKRGKQLMHVIMDEIDVYAVLHRPLPTERDAIRQVCITGERMANGWRWAVGFTCRVAAPEPIAVDGRAEAVAVDLRWRMTDTAIEVAHWLATDGQRDVIAVDVAKGRSRKGLNYGAPDTWLELEAAQRTADEVFEWVKQALWFCLKGPTVQYSEPYRLTRQRGFERLIDAGEYPSECVDALALWRLWTRRQRGTIERSRARLLQRRDDYYYREAHRLCQLASVIVLEADTGDGGKAMNLSELAELPDTIAGRQRHIVAPYRLRQIITQVARKYGTTIELVDCQNTSRTCPSCGEVVKPKRSRKYVCSQGHTFDPPRAATVELLARWRERSGGGETPGGARSRKSVAAEGVATNGGGKVARARRGKRQPLASGAASVAAAGA